MLEGGESLALCTTCHPSRPLVVVVNSPSEQFYETGHMLRQKLINASYYRPAKMLIMQIRVCCFFNLVQWLDIWGRHWHKKKKHFCWIFFIQLFLLLTSNFPLLLYHISSNLHPPTMFTLHDLIIRPTGNGLALGPTHTHTHTHTSSWHASPQSQP